GQLFTCHHLNCCSESKCVIDYCNFGLVKVNSEKNKKRPGKNKGAKADLHFFADDREDKDGR
ncbi:MAG: hypothetical protein ACYSSO_06620, partial [Planctomycetota bacterium]